MKVTEEMINLSTSQGLWATASGTRRIVRNRPHRSPSHRSHSSSVRSELSCFGSPVRRGRSPFTSHAEVPAPQYLANMISTDFMKNVPKTPPAVAYYTVQPPSTPMYLLPISGLYTSHKSDKIQQLLPNPQVKTSDGKKLAEKILRLILKNAMKSVGNEAKSHTSHHMQQVPGKVKNSDVAIQTTPSATDRQSPIEGKDINSFSSGSGEGREGWKWDVRALRDSHVRLVLRQLRQLRNIERLARALRHKPPHPYRTATSHHYPTDI